MLSQSFLVKERLLDIHARIAGQEGGFSSLVSVPNMLFFKLACIFTVLAYYLHCIPSIPPLP